MAWTRRAKFYSTLKSKDLTGALVGSSRLTAPLFFYSVVLGCLVIMRAGSIANSYSVPRLLAFLVWGIDRRPAFIHDEAYRGVLLVLRAPGGELAEMSITRGQADALILEACESVGIAWARRRVIFRGTRIGGWAFFKGGKASPIDPEQPLDHSPGA